MSSASSLTVRRFAPEHFSLLELQPSQAYVRAHTGLAKLLELQHQGPSFTMFSGDQPMCCTGVREYGRDCGVVWSFLDCRAGMHFVAIHRIAMRFIETIDRAHLQATCRTGFGAGTRWLKLLGFTWSRSLGEYGPGRVPHDLFERVRR